MAMGQKYMSTQDIAQEYRFVYRDGRLNLNAVRDLLNRKAGQIRQWSLGRKRLALREDIEALLTPRKGYCLATRLSGNEHNAAAV